MSDKEILEGNKLILEFTGYRFIPDSFGGIIPYWKDGYYFNPSFDESPIILKEAKYHYSWDWLMPVVEKIEAIYDEHHGYFGVHISGNSCSIQGTNLWKSVLDSKYGAVYMSDTNAILDTKIESTWYNVVQFIQWYNENTKK